MITVYTSPDCNSCRVTKKFLMRQGIPFTEVDVTVHQSGDEIRRLGYQVPGVALPVVVTERFHWSGYRHDKLKDLAALWEGEHHG